MSLARFGKPLFALGVLLTFTLIALMTWADVEAISYGFPRVGSEPMRGLTCPPLVTRAENASVTVALRNTTDRPLHPLVQLHISTDDLSRWRTFTQRVDLAPGERKTFSWDFEGADVVLNNFVLVKAYTFATYPMPNTEGSCGSFILDIPWMPGSVLLGLWTAAGLAFLSAGLWMSETGRRLSAQKGGMVMARRVLAALAVIGLVAAYASWWPVSIALLLVMSLTILSMLMIAASS